MGVGLTLEEAVRLYEDAPCGYASLALDGTIVRSNKTFAGWMGCAETEILEGRKFPELLTPPSKLLYGTYYSSLLQVQGTVGDVALELNRSGKPPLAVMITSRVVMDEEKRPTHISSTLFDITERRRYERELIAAKRKADILADVVRFSDTAILTASFDLEVETWNAAAHHLLGGPLVRAKSLNQVLPERCMERFLYSLETSAPVIFEQQLSGKKLSRITAYPLSDGIAVFLADITQERASQTALQQAHERFSLMAMATSDGIWDLNCETDILYTSGRVQAMLGLQEQENTQGLAYWLERVHPEDVAKAQFRDVTLQVSPGERLEIEYRVRHQTGSWRWLHSRSMPLFGPEGTLVRIVGSITDVTLRKQKDALTGLHTRLSLLEHLDSLIKNPCRSDQGFALFFIDLDSFRKVNDGFNYGVGDRVLVEIALRVKAFLGECPLSCAARARADEFIIVVDGVGTPERAWSTAQQLHAALGRPLFFSELHLRISASVGITLSSDAASSAEELLRDADLAMHRAKAEGIGSTVLFSDTMRLVLAERMALEADLYRALETNELLLYYQPQVDLQTERIIGFEALGRWPHPTRGMVPPDTFIRIAEESNLICDIGRWTLQTAIQQLAAWRGQNLVPPDTTVSVNLSPKQFGDPDLVSFLNSELIRNQLPAACLILEITEGVLIGDSIKASRVLAELKEVGIGLDLDDFGKGYSSLSYLDRYPFDTLKIDRAFISRLGGVDDSSTITRSIIALGHALDLKIVAEGIETRDQLSSLLSMGCSLGQGYLFAKPSPASEMERSLCNVLIDRQVTA